MRRRSLAAAMAGLVLVAMACDGGDDESADPTEPPLDVVPPTTDEPRVSDGVLRIGLLTPSTGEGAAIGQSLEESVRAAVDVINATGGFEGQPVELDIEDEGTTAAAAGDAIESLLDDGVDAVVGPTSSIVAMGVLGDLMAGGVLTCSPTATALALDDYPGSELFFRTVPSDSLQAEAIARVAEQTGATTAAVAYLDDVYGRPLAEATIAALEARELTVVEPVPFVATEDSFVAKATQLSDAGVGVIVIIGDADHGVGLLSAIGEVAGRVGEREVPDIVVNDAMRRPSSPQLVQGLPEYVRERVVGVAAIARPPAAQDPLVTDPTGLFATNAHDCVNLIALSALQAGIDDPEAMARGVRGGRPQRRGVRDVRRLPGPAVGGAQRRLPGAGRRPPDRQRGRPAGCPLRGVHLRQRRDRPQQRPHGDRQSVTVSR